MKTVYSYENVLNLIKNLKFETIANSDIIDLICSFGLTYDSRDIYGEYKNCMNKPQAGLSKGIGIKTKIYFVSRHCG